MAEATHLLGLPLKHKMKDISDLAAELQKYLLRSGVNPMTGALNMGGNVIWRLGGAFPYSCLLTASLETPHTLRVMDGEGMVGQGSISVNNVYGLQALGFVASTASISTHYYPTAYLSLYGYNYGWYECARVGHDGVDPIVFSVPRAGNLTLLASKRINALDGILRLPNTRSGTPQANDCRYDPVTDTFEIYDGAQWRAH